MLDERRNVRTGEAAHDSGEAIVHFFRRRKKLRASLELNDCRAPRLQRLIPKLRAHERLERLRGRIVESMRCRKLTRGPLR